MVISNNNLKDHYVYLLLKSLGCFDLFYLNKWNIHQSISLQGSPVLNVEVKQLDASLQSLIYVFHASIQNNISTYKRGLGTLLLTDLLSHAVIH